MAWSADALGVGLTDGPGVPGWLEPAVAVEAGGTVGVGLADGVGEAVEEPHAVAINAAAAIRARRGRRWDFMPSIVPLALAKCK